MKTKIIEATNGVAYGKFLIGLYDNEWLIRPAINETIDDPDLHTGMPVLRQEGWGPQSFLFQDLSNPGNGSIFRHNAAGHARDDVEQKNITVCWLFVEVLQWLYGQNIDDLDALPSLVQLTPAQAS